MAEKKTAIDFEKSLQTLEKLVESMESGEMTLEKSLEAFEKGIKLTKECQHKNEVNGKILIRQQQVYARLLELLRGQTTAPNLYTASGAPTSTQGSFKVDEA